MTDLFESWQERMPEVKRTWRNFMHHVVAHPMLWIWPRLGEWLHGKTQP